MNISPIDFDPDTGEFNKLMSLLSEIPEVIPIDEIEEVRRSYDQRSNDL